MTEHTEHSGKSAEKAHAEEKAREAYARILKSQEYKEFRAAHPKAYLAHCFTTHQDGVREHWQIGFYDPGTDKVTMFEAKSDAILAHPEQEVYKEPGATIEPLYIDEVTVLLGDTLDKIKKRITESYKGEVSSKEICILQHLQDYGTIWNITVLSLTFHVINFKIDAKSGKIIHEQRESLTTWKKDDV